MKKRNGKTSVTTQLLDSNNDLDGFTIKLMLEFVAREFPVKRHKVNTKFKRGIDVDGHIYTIPNNEVGVVSVLYNMLEELYAPKPKEIVYVLENYYKFK